MTADCLPFGGLHLALGPARPTVPPSLCYVAAIQRGEDVAVKIGHARNPRRRLAQLQTACPDRLTLLCTLPGGRVTEQALHRQFRMARISGEWFALTPELLAYLRRRVES